MNFSPRRRPDPDEPIPPGDLPPGEVNVDSIDTFTRGYCAALAYAVHLRTGWNIGLVVDDEGDWLHAVIAMPDGRYIDIEGIAPRQELVDRWGDRSLFMTGHYAADVRNLTIAEAKTYPTWECSIDARYDGHEAAIAPFVDTLLAMVADDRLTDPEANDLLIHFATHPKPEYPDPPQRTNP